MATPRPRPRSTHEREEGRHDDGPRRADGVLRLQERKFFLTRRTWAWEVAFLVYSVAGALSISLIGADQGSGALVLTLMVGAIFWNYLSVVFSWIARRSRSSAGRGRSSTR